MYCREEQNDWHKLLSYLHFLSFVSFWSWWVAWTSWMMLMNLSQVYRMEWFSIKEMATLPCLSFSGWQVSFKRLELSAACSTFLRVMKGHQKASCPSRVKKMTLLPMGPSPLICYDGIVLYFITFYSPFCRMPEDLNNNNHHNNKAGCAVTNFSVASSFKQLLTVSWLQCFQREQISYEVKPSQLWWGR